MMEPHMFDNRGMLRILFKQGVANTKALRTLSLSRCGMTDRNIIDLLKALKKIQLTELNLSENSLGERGVEELGKHVVKFGRYLKILNVYGNNCHDEGAKVLCNAVLKHPNLTSLNIGMNDLTPKSVDSIIYLLRSKSNLHTFECALNFLGRSTSRVLAEMVLNNTIHKLDLSYNCATETSIPLFQRMLRKNKTLTDLNFEGNQLPPEAGNHLSHIFSLRTVKEKDDGETGTKTSENTTLLHLAIFNGNFIPTQVTQIIEVALENNRKNYGLKKYPWRPEMLRPKYDKGKTDSGGCAVM